MVCRKAGSRHHDERTQVETVDVRHSFTRQLSGALIIVASPFAFLDSNSVAAERSNIDGTVPQQSRAIHQEVQSTGMAIRRLGPPVPPISSVEGNALSLGSPGWENAEQGRLKRNYEANRNFELEQRRVAALEKLAGVSSPASPKQETRPEPPVPLPRSEAAVVAAPAPTQATYDREFDNSEKRAKRDFAWFGDLKDPHLLGYR